MDDAVTWYFSLYLSNKLKYKEQIIIAYNLGLYADSWYQFK